MLLRHHLKVLHKGQDKHYCWGMNGKEISSTAGGCRWRYGTASCHRPVSQDAVNEESPRTRSLSDIPVICHPLCGRALYILCSFELLLCKILVPVTAKKKKNCWQSLLDPQICSQKIRNILLSVRIHVIICSHMEKERKKKSLDLGIPEKGFSRDCSSAKWWWRSSNSVFNSDLRLLE